MSIVESSRQAEPPEPSAPPGRAHVVQADRRYRCTSETLPPAALEPLERVLRPWPWFGDRWWKRTVRDAASDLLRTAARGGVAIVGPRMRFQIPSPFEAAFEPIRLGTNDPQLRTLGGDAPTRQERAARVGLWVLAGLGLVLAAPVVIAAFFRALPRRAALTVLGAIGAAALGVLVGVQLSRLGAAWFLLPGAVAIVRRRRPVGERLTLCTRFEYWALLRYVSTGKTVVLVLELRSAEGRSFRRPVSEREAISFLAAWQSPLPPPPPERLVELFNA